MAQKQIPRLPTRTPVPYYFECGSRSARSLKGLDERFRHICTSDSVSGGQRERFLTHVDGSSPTCGVQEETCSNDRIVDAAGANVVFGVPPPAQRVPLDEVEERGAERASGDANGGHVEEAASEARASSGCQGVADAFVLRLRRRAFRAPDRRQHRP